MGMDANRLAGHAAALESELAWLMKCIDDRLRRYFEVADASSESTPSAPNLDKATGAYADAVRRLRLDDAGRLTLILALAPHLRPALLDLFFIRNEKLERGFSEFGGWAGKTHAGFLPTVETVLFLLSGQDLLTRLQLQGTSGPVHQLVSADVLERRTAAAGEPNGAAPLIVTALFLDQMLGGA